LEEMTFLIDLRQVPKTQLRIEPLRELTASDVANIEFRGLEIGRERRIGRSGTNAEIYLGADVVRCILEAAAAIGDGRFFSRRGTQYANERVVFGKPIGSYQGIQFPLARAHVEVEAAAIGLRKATALFDARHDASTASSVAHYLATEAAWNMADAAFTTHGGFAFAREYDIERKWRDVRAAKLNRVFAEGDLMTIATAQLGFTQLGSKRD
jgi:acyl-CoA dehydrogenase